MAKLWSNNGVAFYPPTFAMVGQNRVFNALHQFKEQFTSSGPEDIAGFFVVVGDWGLGKTRLGYELFAETFGHVDRWILNPNEYVLPNTDGRILLPQLAEGILPVYIRYAMVCDEALHAGNWVAKVTCDALSLLHDPPAEGDVPTELLEDLKSALHAKGVDLVALQAALTGEEDYGTRLRAAMDILEISGIHHLWVVVDEIETPGDLKRGLREQDAKPIDEEFLAMVSEVIRHEGFRQVHPNVNFMLLCSVGMSDVIDIGPSRRRTDPVPLEQSQFSDVALYVNCLKDRAGATGESVDYPEGTLEGSFIAANRNFGWFNVIMSTIHTSFTGHMARDERVEAWQLLQEFGQAAARARHVFDLSPIKLIKGVDKLPSAVFNRLLFGQLPVEIGPDLPPEMAKQLLAAEVPGAGPPFAELVQVHLDEVTLATELIKPEAGFKHTGVSDTYRYYNCDLSVGGLLGALRAFSVTAEGEDVIVYADLEQFNQQLATLYPREDIENATEVLYRIFLDPSYRVSGKRFVAVSLELLRQMNRLLTAETRPATFFRDARNEPKIEEYFREITKTERKRQRAACEGLAKVLDNSLIEIGSIPAIESNQHVAFSSEFVSSPMDGLQVTPGGRVTIVYAAQVERLANELAALVGMDGVQPIIILFGPSGDVATFEAGLRRFPEVERCVLMRRLSSFEEDFLTKFSGRGLVFDPSQNLLSARTNGILGTMRDDWRGSSRQWRQKLEAAGWLVRPIWYQTRGLVLDTFHRGFRHMLAEGVSIDGLPVGDKEIFTATDLEQIRVACRKNVDPPAGKPDCLPILDSEPYRPLVPSCFFTLLRELKTQRTVARLVGSFFFSVPASEMKPDRQMQQIVDLGLALGLVVRSGDGYRAVNADTLTQYREAASTWLTGECQHIIDQFRDVLPGQATRIEKASFVFAQGQIAQAKDVAQAADFGLLARAEGSAEEFAKLVRQVVHFRDHLNQVCPAAVYERSGGSFDLAPSQIREYQDRYESLSLWHRVNFLKTLRDGIVEKRNELIVAIRDLMTEAEAMANAKGKPFPLSPLTQPLKAIQQEVEASVVGGATTLRARITVPDYPFELWRYLLDSKYDEAWGRLESLSQMASREIHEGFWTRFRALYEKWCEGVDQFAQADAAWQRLDAFMVDAPPKAWDGAKRLKADYTALRGLVNGSLKNQVDGQVDVVDVDRLIQELQSEVEAALPKLEALPEQIEGFRQGLLRELRQVVNGVNLRALNKVLEAQGEPAMPEPTPKPSYQRTRDAYEGFNAAVVKKGRAFFEGAKRKTSWTLWVELYQDLATDQYQKEPEHDVYLNELEEMRLIERTVRLK